MIISIDKIERKFVFVLAAAKRARQLQGGARPLIQTTAHKPTRIAMEEMIAGVVPFEVPALEEEGEDGKGKKGKGKRASK